VEEATVGQPFEVRLEATGSADTEWIFPEAPGSDAVDLKLEPAPEETAEAPPETLARYRAAIFTTEDAEIPTIVVGYRMSDGTVGEAQTEPIPIRVKSVLPKDPKQQALADVRDPVGLSVGWPFWVALGLLLLLLAGGVGFVLSRRRRPETQTARVPEVPPDREALRALDRLESSGQLGSDPRAFYIELTGITKRYLERRLEAPVLEMTSQEMTTFLHAQPVAKGLAAPLKELTGAADLVKFARGHALEEEAQRHMAAARGAVRTVEDRLAPTVSAQEDGS
jgi:hypothetical protein